jgi:tetrapyrrole methylase family protein/MazG family protein
VTDIPKIDINKPRYDFGDLNAIIAVLLGEGGCPWDLAQTHESLLECLLEECWEVVDAARSRDDRALAEELGDVLLQVVFHSRMAEKDGRFGIGDVVDGVARKMISRHTHIFGKDRAANEAEALETWEANKAIEKGALSPADELRRVPRTFPSALRAMKVFRKARKLGLLPGDAEDVVRASAEALSRLQSALESGDETESIAKYKTFILESSKIPAFLKINAELYLTNALDEFINNIRE